MMHLLPTQLLVLMIPVPLHTDPLRVIATHCYDVWGTIMEVYRLSITS